MTKSDDDSERNELDLIHSYSRRQAIEDGDLVDVTDTAREAGLRFPVAITRAVHVRYVEVPDSISEQDPAGRLWDILWMLRHAIRSVPNAGSVLRFQLLVRNREAGPAELVTLKSVCGPGDEGEPVITIMLPDEE